MGLEEAVSVAVYTCDVLAQGVVLPDTVAAGVALSTVITTGVLAQPGTSDHSRVTVSVAEGGSEVHLIVTALPELLMMVPAETGLITQLQRVFGTGLTASYT